MCKIKEVFLSGAMGCYDPSNSYPYEWREFAKEEINGGILGLTCFNPMDYYNYKVRNEKTQKEIMLFEFQRIAYDSDILLVNLQDLDKSLGTSDEILLAWKLNKPVVGFLEGCTEEDLSKIVHPFKLEQISRIECGEGALTKALTYLENYYGE